MSMKPLYGKKGWPDTMQAALYHNRERRREREYLSKWFVGQYAAKATDGSTVFPTWVMDATTQRYAKSPSPTGSVSQVVFSGLLKNFTRASDATYFDASGTLRTAITNEPRFTYDPATLQPLGLLVEEARTNVLLNSSVLTVQPTNGDNTSTTQYRCRGGYVTVSPVARHSQKYGAGQVFLFTEDLTTDSHALQSPLSIVSSVTNESRAESISVAAGTATKVAITYKSQFLSTNDNHIKVDLAAGTIISSAGGFTDVRIEPEGDGFYRISYKRLINPGNNFRAVTVQTMNASDQTTSFAGTGRTFYYTHPQIEITGGFSSSYIATAESQVTRAADDVFTTDMSWFNPNEGTFIAIGPTSPTGFALGLDTSGGAPRGHLIGSASQSQWFMADTVTTCTGEIVGGYPALGVKSGVGAVYSNAPYTGFARDGILGSSTASALNYPWSPTRLSVGRRYGPSAGHRNAPISVILYYPKRLTSTELQRLTTL